MPDSGRKKGIDWAAAVVATPADVFRVHTGRGRIATYLVCWQLHWQALYTGATCQPAQGNKLP